MRYSEEAIDGLLREEAAVLDRYIEIMRIYLGRTYKTARGKEFAHHGFLRRLRLLARSIEMIFENLPPSLQTAPDDEHLGAAQLALHAFYINSFGAIDNLAWIWVCERGLEIDPRYVGFRPKNADVRKSLPEDFRTYLDGFKRWFEYLERWRHSLAHRVPLYIPQFFVDPVNKDRYEELENLKAEAIRQGDYERFEKLNTEQEQLGWFNPVIMGCFEKFDEDIQFHSQVLNDFLTVEDIARRLDRLL